MAFMQLAESRDGCMNYLENTIILGPLSVFVTTIKQSNEIDNNLYFFNDGRYDGEWAAEAGL